MSAGAGPAPDVRILPAASWAGFVADAFVERLQAEPRLRVCLPTGDTPPRPGRTSKGQQAAWQYLTTPTGDLVTGLTGCAFSSGADLPNQ